MSGDLSHREREHSHGAGGVGLLDKTRLKAATTASGDPDAGATAEILQLGLQFSLRAELGALNKLQNLGVNSI